MERNMMGSGLTGNQKEKTVETAGFQVKGRNRQVIGRIDKKCRESDNVRMTYVNDDSDG